MMEEITLEEGILRPLKIIKIGYGALGGLARQRYTNPAGDWVAHRELVPNRDRDHRTRPVRYSTL